MTAISLALLGPPIVERDTTLVTFDTKKAVALLALLAVNGREQSRERLASQLWPDSDAAHARGSLRRTLSVTAAAVGEGLSITRSAVALRPGLVRVDVADFAALITRPDALSLERGVRLIWVIDPEDRSVTVYRKGAPDEYLTENDTLTGGDVLPGFSVRVAELFA